MKKTEAYILFIYFVKIVIWVHLFIIAIIFIVSIWWCTRFLFELWHKLNLMLFIQISKMKLDDFIT